MVRFVGSFKEFKEFLKNQEEKKMIYGQNARDY